MSGSYHYPRGTHGWAASSLGHGNHRSPYYAPTNLNCSLSNCNASHTRHVISSAGPNANRSPQITYPSESPASLSYTSPPSNWRTVAPSEHENPPFPSPLCPTRSPSQVSRGASGHVNHLPLLRQLSSVPANPRYVDDRSQNHYAPPPRLDVSNRASSQKPSAQDLQRALFLPPFSPPPTHWKALIPVDPAYSPNDIYVPLINRLPVELMSLIFTRCMDDERRELFRAGLRSRSSPLVISSICSRWRGVALDLPVLWQYFALAPCAGHGFHYRIALLFIERSKGQGLHVHYTEDPFDEVPLECCPCALDLILENIGQVKTLELQEISRATAARISQTHYSAATLMQRFSLVMCEDTMAAELVTPISRLYSSANLRELRWISPTFPVNIPWSQMVVLHLVDCITDCDLFMHILMSAPLLEELDVHMEVISPTATPHQPIRHFSMRDFSIEGVGPQDRLLRLLHFPNLTRLSLRPLSSLSLETCGRFGWPFNDPTVFCKFIGRLTMKLKSIRLLYGDTLDEATLLHIIGLPQMSDLRRLHVTSRKILARDAFFANLQPGWAARDGPLLPHLEELAMRYCVTSDGSISRMLQSRRQHSYPLRSVSLGYPLDDSSSHRTDRAAFERLERQGMSISWHPSTHR
ncbi:hypothetical protein BD626DRAFT_435409 [Schizophyllum amplum]|uniref:F-box domain-containing protein n=1 Tax=Schizophyllum amplum TaxID=97359 RepID=A0A550C793_9AGAR|nr:hypothetical protein BD626DRAFT_435409 [Auriculariopsis ampla]